MADRMLRRSLWVFIVAGALLGVAVPARACPFCTMQGETLTDAVSQASMVLLGTPGHDASAYLLVLAVKLLLVTAMTGLALVNQYRLLPNLDRSDNAVRMKRHVVWELGLGLIVIGLAMSLAVLPPTIQ